MVYHIWSIPSLRTITDERLKLSSYIDTIDSIVLTAGKPLVLPPFVLTSKWGRTGSLSDVASFEYRLSIKGPDDKKKKRVGVFPVELLENHRAIAINLEVNGVKLSSPGEWFFYIDWRMAGQTKWKEATKLPIMVSLRAAQKKD